MTMTTYKYCDTHHPLRTRLGLFLLPLILSVLVLSSLPTGCTARSTSSSSGNDGGNWGAPPPPAYDDDSYDDPSESSQYRQQQQHQQQPHPPPRPRPPTKTTLVDEEEEDGDDDDDDNNFKDVYTSNSAFPPPPSQNDHYYDNTDDAWTTNDVSRRTPPPPPRPAHDYRTDEYPGMEDDYLLPSSSSTPTSTSRFGHDRTFGASSSSFTPPNNAAPKIPIHYEFPVAASSATATASGSSADDEDVNAEATDDPTIPPTARASPRQDLITRHMSTTSGKLQVHLSSTLVGGTMGFFLAKSLLPFATGFWTVFQAALWLLASVFLRTAFGELVRAVGLSILLVLQRTNKIRRTYPTWRYVPSALLSFRGRDYNRQRAMRQRLPPPFPPARNPWRYTPRRPTDAEFNMLYSMIAMALVGSTCGGTIRLPMFPTWMGSLAGAGLFVVGCTLTDSPRGDLCRTLGMRVVAFCQELWDIQAQLGIVPKAAIVSGQIIDRIMILDRQHKVKDRFLSVVNAGYEQAMNTASRIQKQRLDAQGRAADEEDEIYGNVNDDDRGGGGRTSTRRRPPVGVDGDRRRPPREGEDNYDDRRPSKRRPEDDRSWGPPPRRDAREEYDYDDRRDGDRQMRRQMDEGDRRPPPRDDGPSRRQGDILRDKDEPPAKRGWFGGR